MVEIGEERGEADSIGSITFIFAVLAVFNITDADALVPLTAPNPMGFRWSHR